MTILAKYVLSASGTYAVGVTLASFTNNPFTFSGNINSIKYTDAGGIHGVGLYLDAYDTTNKGLINWSVTNQSTIAGGVYGVDFHGIGTLTNSGTIAGFIAGPVYGQYGTGVGFFHAGTLVNSGSINGYVGVHLETGGLLSNTGHIGGVQTHIGVRLDNAATATNQAGGIIAGVRYGVAVRYSGVSVTNAGTIEALGGGGSRTNTYAGIIGSVNGGSVTNQAGGLIISPGLGVAMAGAASTVVNAGTISGATYGIRLGGGFANRLVVRPGAVFVGKASGGNSLGSSFVSTLELATGSGQGFLTGIGIKYAGFANVIVDSGASWVLGQANTVFPGYTVTDSGTLINQGVINGQTSVGAGVTVQGGWLSNANTGRITGARYGVHGVSSAATLTDFGVITANTGAGVGLAAGGTIGVSETGTIIGFSYGVSIAGGPGTVVTGGTIIGEKGTAVALPTGLANRLDVYPGAKFTGKANGGGTLSVLELGASGGSVGTIAGFGSQYLNFGTIALDNGARWNLGGSIGAGQTVAFYQGGTSGILLFANPGTMAGTITGFSPGQTIGLGGIVGNATNGTVNAGNTLIVTQAVGPSVTLAFDPAQSFSGLTFNETVSGGQTNLILAIPVGPSLAPESPLSVSIGGTGTISQSMLNTTEISDTPAQLIYSVTSGPANGTLLDKGTAATSFSQADINSGLVTYVEGGVAAASDSFGFKVTDANSNSVLGSFPITLISAKPVLVDDTGLTVGVSATATITADDLLSTETGIMPAQMVYSVTTAPADGVLQANGVPVKSFTQADIDNGLVSYLETNGTATADSFGFTLTDPSKATLPGTFKIKVIPRPIIAVDLGLTIAASGTAAITSTLLQTTENGEDPAKLNYTVSILPLLGTLLDNGVATSSFTQADINAGLVTYQANGTAAASDAFTFNVTDENHTSVTASFPITITKKLAPTNPVVTVDTGMTVSASGSATITAAMLMATENGDTPAQLTYTVANGPSFGTVRNNGTVVTSFTQDNVDNGLITYQAGTSAALADAFGFTVTDPNGGNVDGLFSITIQGTTAPPATGASIAAAYQAVLRVPPPGGANGVYATAEAAVIDNGQQTETAYVASLIAMDQALYTTEAALVTIDAFYGATPTSSLLTTVATATSGTSYVTATELHNLGYSDTNVWTILGSGWSADHSSAFFAQYGSLASGSVADYTTLITELYTREFGFAPSAANLLNLLGDIPGTEALLNGGGNIATPIQVMGGIYGYLLEVGQVNGIGQYGNATSGFLQAAANGTVIYGQELTQEFPLHQTSAVSASASEASTGDIVTITGSNQLIDPGVGSFTIQFAAGASADTLVLHANGEDQVSGFDTGTDVLDLRSLLSEAGVNLTSDVAALGNYLTVADQDSNAVLNFDPSGHAGGSAVAVLQGLGGTVTGLNRLLAQGAIRIS